jgi:alkylation response protein AidB-like acyl-CoA dehydrogenase
LRAARRTSNAIEAVVDRALEAHDAGGLTAVDVASAKLFCTETAARVIDRCLQLHGGYGYMNEHPIARIYADNRVHRIYGGTSEVMKIILAKTWVSELDIGGTEPRSTRIATRQLRL